MLDPRSRFRLRAILLMPLVLGVMCKFTIAAKEAVKMAEIAPNLLVFETVAGNVVVSVGPDGALLIGTPSKSSTARISSVLSGRTNSALRYVIIFPQDADHSEGDAGWGRLGAFVAMQENALRRLGGNEMGPPPPLSRHLGELGVDRPRIAFSEVLAFDLNGESIHIVRQKPGFSNADAIAHFHVAKLVYLGEVFPGDGYPTIDPSQGGTLDGLMKTLDAWTDSTFTVVPARGPVTNGARVKSFRDMIGAVRDRVQHMIDEGRSESQVLVDHPTADFDAQWGHGRAPPDAFVREIYAALKGQ